MPDLSILAVFIPTIFFVSIIPGLCMTLAMTLGMTVGVRRTMWMMLGEVTGVALVAIAAVLGIAAIMLNYPLIFNVFRWLGGVYLAYLGFKMWCVEKQSMEMNHSAAPVGRLALMSQGFFTAIMNPKGWAFMISLLPPFIETTKPIIVQLSVLVTIIMCSEFLCMLVYAYCGRSLSIFLARGDNLRWLNRIAGACLFGVGIWLALG